MVERFKSIDQEVSIFGGDVRDRSSIRAWLEKACPEVVVHLAARVAIDKVDAAPLEAFEVNVEGTVNLMWEAARLDPLPRVFFASTSHVYQGSERPIRESDQLSPQNIYAQSKVIAESAAEFIARHRPLPLCIGRIFSFYHASQRPPFMLPSMLARLQTHTADQPFLVRNGLDVRDLSNAEDIAGLVVRLSLSKATGIVNVGSGIATRILDFVQQISGARLSVVADQRRGPTYLVADVTRLNEALRGSAP